MDTESHPVRHAETIHRYKLLHQVPDLSRYLVKKFVTMYCFDVLYFFTKYLLRTRDINIINVRFHLVRAERVHYIWKSLCGREQQDLCLLNKCCRSESGQIDGCLCDLNAGIYFCLNNVTAVLWHSFHVGKKGGLIVE